MKRGEALEQGLRGNQFTTIRRSEHGGVDTEIRLFFDAATTRGIVPTEIVIVCNCTLFISTSLRKILTTLPGRR